MEQKQIGVLLKQLILNQIDTKSSSYYYVGGSLCLDFGNGNGGTVMINLDETFSSTESEGKKLLNFANTIMAFVLYRKVKGDTDYFKKNLKKSFVRHIFNLPEEVFQNYLGSWW